MIGDDFQFLHSNLLEISLVEISGLVTPFGCAFAEIVMFCNLIAPQIIVEIAVEISHYKFG